MLMCNIIFQTAKEVLEETEKELSRKNPECSRIKREERALGEIPPSSTPPDQLSKSARKRQWKKALKKNKEIYPSAVITDKSEETVMARGHGLNENSATAILAEPTSDEKVSHSNSFIHYQHSFLCTPLGS